MEILKTKFLQEKIVNLFNLKSIDDISEEVLDRVEDITLNCFDFKKRNIEYDFSDLKFMPNIKSITFNDFELNETIANSINELSKLTTITLNNCDLKSKSEINTGVQTIFLSNSDFECMDFFKNKESIRHIYMQDMKDYINLEQIKECINIEKMDLLNSDIINTKALQNFNKLKELNLSGSRADELEPIDNLKIKVIRDAKYYNIV